MDIVDLIPMNALPGQRFPVESEKDVSLLAQTITVAIPLTGKIHPELAECVSQWSLAGVEIMPVRNHGGFLEVTRTHAVKHFLESTNNSHNFLIMIDSDIVPDDPNSILQLAHWNLPVVGGVAPVMHPHAGMIGNFAVDKQGKELFPVVSDGAVIPKQGIAEVQWIGAGLLCLRRDVLKALENHFVLTDEERARAIDTGFMDSTEDKSFCLKAREAGYPIYADFGVTAGHSKPQILRYPDYLKK